MALVHFQHFLDGELMPEKNITKRMFAPTKAGVEMAWYNQARKTIKEIPNLKKEAWLMTSNVTVNWIRWDLHKDNSTERCEIFIDRTYPSM